MGKYSNIVNNFYPAQVPPSNKFHIWDRKANKCCPQISAAVLICSLFEELVVFIKISFLSKKLIKRDVVERGAMRSKLSEDITGKEIDLC